jgi:acetyltransferase
MDDLEGLFDPTRVAVIGATEDRGSVGRAVVVNLESFEGEVVPVNPNRERVFGRDCYPSITAVPAAVDVAVVIVPAAVAVDVVRECGEAGVTNVVVITAGFGEAGPEGERREAALTTVAEEYDLNLVGPNCLGVIATRPRLNATFAQQDATPGSIALMSQSGAFITAVLDWAGDAGLGFSEVVSLGNEAVLDEVDFLEAFDDDPATDVILAYLEDVEEGRRFVHTAREVTGETPVVVLKSGRTDVGARAAASHTGSIAGSDRAYEAGFEQAGVVRARTVQELFDAARALAGQPLPTADSVAIVTNAGGPGVIAADAVGDTRLDLTTFSPETTDRLRDRLPARAEVGNPLDIIGDASLDRYRASLEAVLADDTVGGVVTIAAPTAIFDFDELVAVIRDVSADHDTPLVTCLMGGDEATRAARGLAEDGIPNYFDPDRAVRGLAALSQYRVTRGREYGPPASYDVDRERAEDVIAAARERGKRQLGLEAIDLLDAYGIPTAAGDLATTPEEAAAIAKDIDDGVALKIVSPDVVHKTDVGGVEVDVPPGEAADAYERIAQRVRGHHPAATVTGVYVQAMVDSGDATETLLGMHRDPQFGPLVVFGLGGVFVEILEDATTRVAPLSKAEARAMTEEIRSAPMLRGARGREPADLDAVVESICRLSQLAVDFPEIRELDVNPLIASSAGVIAVDLRLTLSE